MFKNLVNYFLTESKRSQKVAKNLPSNQIGQLKGYFRGDKETSGFLKDTLSKTKAAAGTASAPKIKSKALKDLEQKNPKVFEKVALNAGKGVTVKKGEHTPLKSNSKDHSWRVSELVDLGYNKEEIKVALEKDASELTGKEKRIVKEYNKMENEDKKDDEKSMKAGMEWKKGEEVPTADDETKLVSGHFKTKAPADNKEEFKLLLQILKQTVNNYNQ